MMGFLSNTLPALKLLPLAAGAALGATLMLGVARVYDNVIDDPSVRKAALKDYVAKVELDAANARLEEMTRQKVQADAALEDFQRKVAAFDTMQQTKAVVIEQDIAEHERLTEKGGVGGCKLSPADIDWLRK